MLGVFFVCLCVFNIVLFTPPALEEKKNVKNESILLHSQILLLILGGFELINL